MKKILLIIIFVFLIFQVIAIAIEYTSQYPPAHSDTYVKATTKYDEDYWQYFATDPTKSLLGTQVGNCWLSQTGEKTNQRFHIDLGSAKIIRRIYYENFHSSGNYTDRGVNNFTLLGSNTEASFLELTYLIDTDWTELTVSQNTFDEHSEADEADPKYITVTNETEYRYYAFKFADNHDNATWMGVRRIELQTEDAAGWDHKWNTQTISKWNTKEFTKWNGLE